MKVSKQKVLQNLFTPLACGVLFGFGLAMSDMTNVARVVGFLDVFGQWDPTLAFVMLGGLLVTLPFFQLILPHLKTPALAPEFHLPTKKDLEAQLVGGAMLFGMGWGMSGLCPGPAIASIAYLNPDLLYFLVSMFAGMVIADISESRLLASTA